MEEVKVVHTQVEWVNNLRVIFIMNIRYNENYREHIYVGVGTM